MGQVEVNDRLRAREWMTILLIVSLIASMLCIVGVKRRRLENYTKNVSVRECAKGVQEVLAEG